MFFLILSLVSIYTMFSAAFIMVRLRSLTKQRNVEGGPSLQCSLAALHARSANVGQLVGATFYLFGLIFFLTLPLASRIVELSRTPVSTLIWENFIKYFACLVSVIVVGREIDYLGPSEFSGGYITGRLFWLADKGWFLCLLALLLTFVFRRAAAWLLLVASLFCWPLYLYVTVPGVARRLIRPLLTNVVWDSALAANVIWDKWLIAGML
jgi:hypothetical protein